MLKNKIVLVTGGGRGIGRGITQKFLKYGAHVIIAQRNVLPEDLQHNDKVSFYHADFAQPDSIKALAQAIIKDFSNLDVIVNNAGIMWEDHISSMTEERWHQMLQINTTTPVFLTKYLLPILNKESSSVINIGSIEGISANPDHTAYGASKGALHSATVNMALDLGTRNIRVNAIAPGWITSDLAEKYIGAQENPEQAKIDLEAMHPIGRVGQPDDIGGVCIFLASDDLSAFVTGQVIVVDGGRLSKIPLPF